MIEDTQLLNDWYHYASQAEGFIGAVLKAHRTKAFMTQEQQRNLLGILDTKYDQFWLQLQVMLLPRSSQFETDIQRIVADVSSKTGIEADVNVEQLMDLVQTGLEP